VQMVKDHRRAQENQRALQERHVTVEQRVAIVTEYRDNLIQKRDRKAEQIPLRPHEERMWANKIAQAQATIDALSQELAQANG
jgi:hypothetical protein